MSKQNDEEMIRNPDQWPCWPYLPVKRHDAKGHQWGTIEDMRMGVVLSDHALVKHGKPTVYHVYLYDLPRTPEEFKACPKTEYQSISAMLAEGWVVD